MLLGVKKIVGMGGVRGAALIVKRRALSCEGKDITCLAAIAWEPKKDYWNGDALSVEEIMQSVNVMKLDGILRLKAFWNMNPDISITSTTRTPL
jgi:hypothetical protein